MIIRIRVRLIFLGCRLYALHLDIEITADTGCTNHKQKQNRCVSETAFTTTAFAYTGDDVQKNTPVSTAAQETDAAESTNAGKTDNTDSIEIDPDMLVLPDGYEVSTDADGNLIVSVGGKEYNIGSEKSQKQTGTVAVSYTHLWKP